VLARSQIPKRALDSSKLYLFENLLPEYGISDVPGKYLFTAGNNAHFNLKLLLAQTVRLFQGSAAGNTPERAARLQTLESIAQASIEEELSRDTPDRVAYLQYKAKKDAVKLEAKKDRKVCVLAQRGTDWYDNLEGGIDMKL
jgi:hypothetical protein